MSLLVTKSGAHLCTKFDDTYDLFDPVSKSTVVWTVRPSRHFTNTAALGSTTLRLSVGSAHDRFTLFLAQFEL